MPQKQNPDVCELVRAKAVRVKAAETAVFELVRGAPTGYNRNLQEAKEPFMEGMATTRASLRVMAPMLAGMEVNVEKLVAGFSPDVFATDRALELVAEGVPFRDAYHAVKGDLGALAAVDPREAIRLKEHMGAPFGLDWALYAGRIKEVRQAARKRKRAYERALSALMNAPYVVGG